MLLPSAIFAARLDGTVWTTSVALVLYAVIALAILVCMWLIVSKWLKLQARIREEEKNLDNAKAKLSADFYNEFRAPLALVLDGIEEISRNTPDGDRNEHSIQVVRDNTNKMIMLVGELADIRESEEPAAGKSDRSSPPRDEVVINSRDKDLIDSVQRWLEANIADTGITVDMLAAHVGMGRTSLYNKIKGLTGKSPVELIQDFRMEKATYYLKLGKYSVSEVSYKVGFSDPGYFSRTFKKHFGISPSEYIKDSKNM